MDQELLTLKDVARALSVSPRHVSNLHKNGGIPAPVRLGRSVRWRRDDVIAWLEAQCPARERWEAEKGEPR